MTALRNLSEPPQARRAAAGTSGRGLLHVAEREPVGQLVFVGEHAQPGPGRGLDLDAVAATLDLAAVLDLTGIEDAARTLGRRRLLQVFDEIADILLELGQWPESIDL